MPLSCIIASVARFLQCVRTMTVEFPFLLDRARGPWPGPVLNASRPSREAFALSQANPVISALLERTAIVPTMVLEIGIATGTRGPCYALVLLVERRRASQPPRDLLGHALGS